MKDLELRASCMHAFDKDISKGEVYPCIKLISSIQYLWSSLRSTRSSAYFCSTLFRTLLAYPFSSIKGLQSVAKRILFDILDSELGINHIHMVQRFPPQ